MVLQLRWDSLLKARLMAQAMAPRHCHCHLHLHLHLRHCLLGAPYERLPLFKKHPCQSQLRYSPSPPYEWAHERTICMTETLAPEIVGKVLLRLGPSTANLLLFVSELLLDHQCCELREGS